MPALPPAFLAWYRSSYPTLQFNPEWLDACVEYLQESDPSASTVQGLIKAVEVQLLSSDLSTSILLPTPAGRRAALTTRTPASARTVLFAGGRKGAVLFQVQRAGDAAHSAVQGREVLAEKREARKLAAGAPGGGGARIMDLGEEEEDGPEAKDAVLDLGKAPAFPRGSGSFVLFDGETEVCAYERERVDGLGLEEVKLGTKLLIHDAPFVNGIMMLTRQNTVVKGYQVEELEAIKEWLLENGFRERLGMDPLPPPEDAAPPPSPGAAAAPSPPPRSPRARQRPPPPPPAAKPKERAPSSDYFGDDLDLAEIEAEGMGAAGDEDEEEALRAMEEEAAAAAAPPPRPQPEPRPKRATQVKPEPRSSGSGGNKPAAGRAATGLSGEVEVLELESDDEDEVMRPADVKDEDDGRKRRKVEGGKKAAAGSRAGAAKTKGRTMVLEIDSDD
ncbi:hypothetical protein JCM10450v2_006810 [Rhodotorula kratochvilovae]